jgi:hypothetical protein
VARIETHLPATWSTAFKSKLSPPAPRNAHTDNMGENNARGAPRTHATLVRCKNHAHMQHWRETHNKHTGENTNDQRTPTHAMTNARHDQRTP